MAGTGLACATLLILAPCLAPALAPDDVSEAAGWTRYRFEKSRFSVRLPQPPERAERSRSTPVGTLYEAHYTVEADGLRLIVEHYQLPAIALWLVPDQLIVDRAVASLLEDSGVREPLRSRPLENGRPGRVLSYALPEEPGVVEEARIVLVDRRLYVALAADTRPEPGRERIERFFASLDISDS